MISVIDESETKQENKLQGPGCIFTRLKGLAAGDSNASEKQDGWMQGDARPAGLWAIAPAGKWLPKKLKRQLATGRPQKLWPTVPPDAYLRILFHI